MDNTNISKSSVLSNVIWRFGERILAQLTTFAVSVVLARKLSASDFGDVALLMVFIDIANTLVIQGFASALIQKKDADDKDFSSVFFFSLLTSVVFYIILYVFAPLLRLIGDPLLPSLFRVLSLRVILAAVNSVQHAFVQKHMLFKKFFFSTLIGTIVSAFVGIYMAYSGAGAWAIVAQYLTNTLFDTIVLSFTIGWCPRLFMDFERIKTLFGFGWKMLCSGLVHVIYGRLQAFFIGTMYSTADLAFYEQGAKIPGIVETNIDSTINSVLFPLMAAEQDDVGRIKEMIRRSIRTTGFLIWPMMMGMAVLADQLISFVFGEKWLPAGIFMILACFRLTIEPIQTANLQAIKAIGRSDLYLKMEIIKKVFGLVVILVGVRISVLATAVATLLQFVFAGIVNGAVNRRLFKYRIQEQLYDIIINACLSIIMAGIVLIVKNMLDTSLVLKLVLEIIIGVIVYTLLVLAFNRKQMDYVVNMIRRR